jgi:UDP-N-acetylmuramoyl-L-alanyl-D-glutamate--2,6-diaminopimelate ligase
MKLREIAPADAEFDARRADINVSGVTADSRMVKRGDVFVAITGGKADGARFIDPAIAAGAVAIVAERAPATPLPAGIVFMRVANARRAVASIASKLFPRGSSVHATDLGWEQASRREHWHGRNRIATRRDLRRTNDTRPG